MAFHVQLRRGGVFSTVQATIWDLSVQQLNEDLLRPRTEGRPVWASGYEFPWVETHMQVYEGPATADVPEFSEIAGPSLYSLTGQFHDVTDKYISGPPGKASPLAPTPSPDTPAMSADVRYQVFLSSTFVDLQPERIAVTQELLKMGRCIPAGMELFGASSLPPWDFITKVLDVTDYVVLVLGHRYGSVPPSGGASYTEREYDYAMQLGIPVLAFTPAPGRPVLPEHMERRPGGQRALKAFTSRVQDAHLVTDWTDATDLAGKVTTSLWKEFSQTPRPGWVRGSSAGHTARGAQKLPGPAAAPVREQAVLDALQALAALDAAMPHMDYRFAFIGSEVPAYVHERRARAERAADELRRAEIASIPLLGKPMQRRWIELRELADQASRTGEIGSVVSREAAVALGKAAADTHAALVRAI